MYPAAPRRAKPAGDPYLASLEKGLKGMMEKQKHGPPGSGVMLKFPGLGGGAAPGGAAGGAPGGGAGVVGGLPGGLAGGALSGSEDGAGSEPSSRDTDQEEWEAAAGHGPKPKGAPCHWVPYGHGQILVNRSGKSIDALCYECGAGFDRSWKPRKGARQGHTKAQGRPLGSQLAWLCLECHGDPEWHSRQFSDEGLPRVQRKAARREAKGSGEFDEFFDRERSPRASESEGEPQHVPNRAAA